MTLAPAALAVTLGMSLAWSGFDSLRKALVRELAPLPLLFLLTAASLPPLAVWALLDRQVVRLPPGYLAPALASIALNVVSNLAFVEALRRAPLSATVPLLSLTPVFTALLAIPLLHELPTLRTVLGILLVVAGALLLGIRRGTGSPRPRQPPAPGVLLILLVAFLWSLTITLDKLAVERSSAPFHGLCLNSGVTLGLLAVLLARRRLGEVAGVTRAPRLFLFAVAVSTLALALQLLALQLVWVSWVETMKRGIGNLMAVVLGRLAFGEAVTAVKLLAVGSMAAGVALILI
jgi:drug/metabolite transporter (DMT)-like permease